ncbi:MAG: DUF481 domain-containing protein [Polyangiaceae bacterium]
MSAFAVGGLLLAHSVVARAQVNTEPLRKKLKTKGWSFTLQGSLDAREGNTQGVDASTAGGVGFATGRHLGFIFGSAELARFNGVTSIDNSFVHARYNYEFLSWLWGEAFAQLQSDEFQRILLRDLVGLGPRFGAYQSKSLDVFVGTGWMVEHDAINAIPGSGDRTEFNAHRWNNYVSANYELDTRVSFASTLYVQPRWNDFSDCRVLESSALIFKITTALAASIVGTYHYDSSPPTGVKTTDVDVKNVLSVTY